MIQELIDSILIQRGLRSYSHQAPIVYAKDNKIISEKDAIFTKSFEERVNEKDVLLFDLKDVEATLK